jgi:hypothetical protein
MSARPGPCGGHSAKSVPTAISQPGIRGRIEDCTRWPPTEHFQTRVALTINQFRGDSYARRLRERNAGAE